MTVVAKTTNFAHRGKEFEAELEAAHDFYRLKGLVDVVKNPSGWEFCGEKEYNRLSRIHLSLVTRDGTGRMMKRVKSDVDFSGGNGTRSFCFDAKQTSDASFPLDSIHEHQVIRLRVSAKCGVTAGVMIKLKKHDRVFFVPVAYIEKRFERWQIEKIAKKTKRGTASLSIEDLEANGTEIKQDRKSGLWDWYAALAIGEKNA